MQSGRGKPQSKYSPPRRGGECAWRKTLPRKKQESTDSLHKAPLQLVWNRKIRIFQRQFPEVLLSDNNDSLVANERRIRFQIHLLRTKYSLIEAPDVTRPGLPVGIRSFSLEESYFRVIHAGIGGHIGRHFRLSIPKRDQKSRSNEEIVVWCPFHQLSQFL